MWRKNFGDGPGWSKFGTKSNRTYPSRESDIHTAKRHVAPASYHFEIKAAAAFPGDGKVGQNGGMASDPEPVEI